MPIPLNIYRYDVWVMAKVRLLYKYKSEVILEIRRKMESSLVDELFENNYVVRDAAKKKALISGISESEYKEILHCFEWGYVERGDIDTLITVLGELSDTKGLLVLIKILEVISDGDYVVRIRNIIFNIMQSCSVSVSNDILERIAVIPDMSCTFTYQSDYSWDNGTTEYSLVRMDSLRELAINLIKVR
jgi:hypothetical protein